MHHYESELKANKSIINCMSGAHHCPSYLSVSYLLYMYYFKSESPPLLLHAEAPNHVKFLYVILSIPLPLFSS